MKLTPFETGIEGNASKWYVQNHGPRTAGFEFDDKVAGTGEGGFGAGRSGVDLI